MRLVEMTNLDYGGYLFLTCPDGVSMETHRERIEDMAAEMEETDDEDCGFSDTEDTEPFISPSILARIYCENRRLSSGIPDCLAYARLPIGDREALLAKRYGGRFVSHSAKNACLHVTPSGIKIVPPRK